MLFVISRIVAPAEAHEHIVLKLRPDVQLAGFELADDLVALPGKVVLVDLLDLRLHVGRALRLERLQIGDAGLHLGGLTAAGMLDDDQHHRKQHDQHCGKHREAIGKQLSHDMILLGNRTKTGADGMRVCYPYYLIK